MRLGIGELLIIILLIFLLFGNYSKIKTLFITMFIKIKKIVKKNKKI